MKKVILSILTIVLGIVLLQTPIVSFSLTLETSKDLSLLQNFMVMAPGILPLIKIISLFKYKDFIIHTEEESQFVVLVILTTIGIIVPMIATILNKTFDVMLIIDNSYAYVTIAFGCIMSLIDTLSFKKKLAF